MFQFNKVLLVFVSFNLLACSKFKVQEVVQEVVSEDIEIRSANSEINTDYPSAKNEDTSSSTLVFPDPDDIFEQLIIRSESAPILAGQGVGTITTEFIFSVNVAGNYSYQMWIYEEGGAVRLQETGCLPMNRFGEALVETFDYNLAVPGTSYLIAARLYTNSNCLAGRRNEFVAVSNPLFLRAQINCASNHFFDDEVCRPRPVTTTTSTTVTSTSSTSSTTVTSSTSTTTQPQAPELTEYTFILSPVNTVVRADIGASMANLRSTIEFGLAGEGDASLAYVVQSVQPDLAATPEIFETACANIGTADRFGLQATYSKDFPIGKEYIVTVFFYLSSNCSGDHVEVRNGGFVNLGNSEIACVPGAIVSCGQCIEDIQAPSAFLGGSDFCLIEPTPHPVLPNTMVTSRCPALQNLSVNSTSEPIEVSLFVLPPAGAYVDPNAVFNSFGELKVGDFGLTNNQSIPVLNLDWIQGWEAGYTFRLRNSDGDQLGEALTIYGVCPIETDWNPLAAECL